MLKLILKILLTVIVMTFFSVTLCMALELPSWALPMFGAINGLFVYFKICRPYSRKLLRQLQEAAETPAERIKAGKNIIILLNDTIARFEMGIERAKKAIANTETDIAKDEALLKKEADNETDHSGS